MDTDVFGPTEVLFQQFSKSLEKETETREEIKKMTKEIEQIVRQISVVMQQIHEKIDKVAAICKRAKDLMQSLRISFAKLQSIVKPDQYYKYHDHWKFAVSQIVSLCALISFLESGTLVTIPEVELLLGVPGENAAFCVELEDYLLGLCNVPNDLSRLCVNSVTAGNYELPLKISQFVGDLYAGFRLLNLKNDNLRKRYDSIKYDMKKIEEVVYDVNIRGLAKKH